MSTWMRAFSCPDEAVNLGFPAKIRKLLLYFSPTHTIYPIERYGNSHGRLRVAG